MNLPVFALVSQSDWMAQAVLVFLGLFSCISWVIIINRLVMLSAVRNKNKQFIRSFSEFKSIREVEKIEPSLRVSPAGVLADAGLVELKRIIADAKIHKGITDWSFYLQNQFHMAQEKFEAEVGRLSRKQDWGLYLLAVISSAAPFLGLFGTVWGIMLSFYQISAQDSASLAVVAPGISAALITTIVGLAVAIPSVIFYNIFQHKVERIEDELDEFSDRIYLTVKKELFNMIYADKGSKGTGEQ